MRKLFPCGLVALVIFLGVWLRRAALHAGFWSDDYLQYAMLHGDYPLARAPWDLFRFSDGSSAEVQAHIDFGSFPYWSDPHFKLALLRPLASLSHAFDYRVFGTEAFKHHAHSFVWWGLSVISVAVCLRKCFSLLIAVLALLIYALDEAHSIPLAWLANRSPLMAAAFGFAALAAHLAFRATPSLGPRLCSLGLFAGALACGEYALSMLGYFAALELLTPGTWQRKLRGFAPFLGLGVAFVLGSTLAGYGSGNSGTYVSPIQEPVRFLSKLLVGVPVMSADLLLTFSADFWTFGPMNGERAIPHSLYLAGGILAPVFGALLLGAAAPGLTREEAANARWLALGAWLSLIPVSGSFVSSRLCVVGSAGAAALIASSIVGIARRLRALRVTARLASGVLIIGLVFLHMVRGPGLSIDMSRLIALFAHSSTAGALSLQLDPRQASKQRAIQLSAIEASNASYLPFIRDLYQLPMPSTYRILSPISLPLRLHRVSDNTIELAFDFPEGLPSIFSAFLTRSGESLLQPGSVIHTRGIDAHVLEVHSGAPTRVQFELDVSVDDPSLVFFESTELGLRRVTPPKLGETLEIGPARPPLLGFVP